MNEYSSIHADIKHSLKDCDSIVTIQTSTLCFCQDQKHANNLPCIHAKVTECITYVIMSMNRRTREGIYIEKWDQTDSPEIPDRGGDIRIASLPSADSARPEGATYIIRIIMVPLHRRLAFLGMSILAWLSR